MTPDEVRRRCRAITVSADSLERDRAELRELQHAVRSMAARGEAVGGLETELDLVCSAMEHAEVSDGESVGHERTQLIQHGTQNQGHVQLREIHVLSESIMDSLQEHRVQYEDASFVVCAQHQPLNT